MKQRLHEHEMAIFEEAVAPAMAEVQQLLKKTNDSISDEALELLARWKLHLEK